jgi:hypothetical protein
MNFIANVLFSFRNTETKRKISPKMDKKNVETILKTISNNYEQKDQDNDNIDAFSIIYTGAEGSIRFSLYLELSKNEKNENLNDEKLIEQCKLCINTLLIKPDNGILTVDINNKTLYFEIVETDIFRGSIQDFDEMEKKQISLVQIEKNKSNGTKVKKEKKVVEDAGSVDTDDLSDISNVSQEVEKLAVEANKLVEKLNKTIISRKSNDNKSTSSAEEKRRAKEIALQQKELEKKHQAEQRKAAIIELKKLKKEETQSLINNINNMKINERRSYIAKMKEEIIETTDVSNRSDELLKIIDIEKCVEKHIKLELATYKKDITSVMKNSTEKYYTIYNTLKLYLGKLVKKIPLENAEYQQEVDDIQKFSTTLSDCLNNYINWKIDVKYLNTTDYVELHMDADQATISILKQLFENNNEKWFHNSNNFKSGTKIQALIRELSYWEDQEDNDDDVSSCISSDESNGTHVSTADEIACIV